MGWTTVFKWQPWYILALVIFNLCVAMMLIVSNILKLIMFCILHTFLFCDKLVMQKFAYLICNNI